MDSRGLPSGDNQSPVEEGDLLPSSPFVQGQPIALRKKQKNPFVTRKGMVFSGLALLIIVMSLGAGLLALRVLTKPGAVEKWSLRPGDYTPFSPITVNGIMYVLSEGEPSGDGTLHALDASSGREKWSYSVGSSVRLSPIVVNDIVYVASNGPDTGDSTVDALDAASGNVKWTYQIEDWISPLSSPTVGNGLVYILSEKGSLNALNARSGTKVWTKQIGAGAFAFFSPIAANGIVYVVSNNTVAEESIVYAFDMLSGQQKWSYHLGTFTTAPLEVVNGMLYVTSDGGLVNALDTGSGQKKWSYSTGGTTLYSPPTIANGVAYIASTNHTLYALDAGSGHEKWSYKEGTLTSLSPIIANGTVYVISSNLAVEESIVYALDASSGRQMWSYQGGYLNAMPTVANGMIYGGTFTGTVYALAGQSGNEKWTYQTGDNISFSPMVANGAVYVASHDNLDAIWPLS